MALHADGNPLSVMAGATVRRAGTVGLLSDTTVAAADTLNGLDAAVDNAVVHADVRGFAGRVKRAWRLNDEFTNAGVLSLTTVAGLYALATAYGTSPRQDLLID